jgi:hypothetical protein
MTHLELRLTPHVEYPLLLPITGVSTLLLQRGRTAQFSKAAASANSCKSSANDNPVVVVVVVVVLLALFEYCYKIFWQIVLDRQTFHFKKQKQERQTLPLLKPSP